MKPFVILVLAFALSTPSTFGADETQAVKTVLSDQVASWNRGDLEGFMKGYWNDEKLTFFSGGTVTKGWKPVMERYHKRYKAEGKEMGQLTFSGIEVELLGENDAFVRGKWKLVTSKETDEGLYTLLLKKRSEGWRIVHDHTSK